MTAYRLTHRLIGPIDRLIGALIDPARRERTAAAVLMAYVAIWTLYAALAKASQDMHFDMVEVVAWSRELAFGYSKHPPLSAWLAAAWFALFPTSDWAFHLLAVTVAGVTLWIAWRLAGDYLDGEKRVLALAVLMLVPFFNFHVLKFNANTVLLPAWAATTLCFLRSFERLSVPWAALAGLCAAAAMLGKYWSIFLVMGLGVAALVDSRRAAYFRSPAPWVTIGVGALALAPHFAWLAVNDFVTFSYAAAVHVRTVAQAAGSVVGYLAGSAGYVALPVLLVLAAVRPSRAAVADMLLPKTPERRLVAAAFWAPLLLPAVVAPIMRAEITSLWSMSAWTLLPVVLLSSPLLALGRRALLPAVTLAVLLPPVMVVAAPFVAIAIHRGKVPPAVAHSRLIADRVAHEWRRVTDRPLQLVGGGDLAYGVAFYLPDRPSAFPEFDSRVAPWADWHRVRREGIAIVCRADAPTCPLAAEAQSLTGPRVEIEVARSHYGIAGPAGRYVIVIIPPQGEFQ
jgi:4-amino-4-deoxy-L-arabinose transferase-like glycosyltransferase